MSNVFISQGETSRKRIKCSNPDETNAAVNVNNMRSCLPDLVIHRILTLLSTKTAVRMSFLSKQWEGVWSLSPVVDFDEYDDIFSDHAVEHGNFIEILRRYLQFREKDKTTPIFDKFRLRMRRYSPRDSTIVDKWLDFAFERDVKEVDLKLRIKWNTRPEFYHGISRMRFLNANSITTLSVEFVRIESMYGTDRLLPCLKNMSLKSVRFSNQALPSLTRQCPSIECLSLTSCYFEDSTFHVTSSSLKSLEATHCVASFVIVGEAVNLDYFTYSSKSEKLKGIMLLHCFKLRYISIHAQQLKELMLDGCQSCHDSLKATINTPCLRKFSFRGFLNSKVSLLSSSLERTDIMLWDIFGGASHCLELRDFLKAFDGSHNVTLFVRDFRVLIFPQNFRETFSSPLCKIRELKLKLWPNIVTNAKDISDLNESLRWIAPSAKMAPSSTWPQAPTWPLQDPTLLQAVNAAP